MTIILDHGSTSNNKHPLDNKRLVNHDHLIYFINSVDSSTRCAPLRRRDEIDKKKKKKEKRKKKREKRKNFS